MNVGEALLCLEAYRRAATAGEELADAHVLRVVADDDAARVQEWIRSVLAAHAVPGEPALELEERLLELGIACARGLLGRLDEPVVEPGATFLRVYPERGSVAWVQGVLAELETQLEQARQRHRFALEGPWVELVLAGGKRCDALLLYDALGLDRQELLGELAEDHDLSLAARHTPVRPVGPDTWLEVVKQLLGRPLRDDEADPEVLQDVVDRLLEGLPVARPAREWLHPRTSGAGPALEALAACLRRGTRRAGG